MRMGGLQLSPDRNRRRNLAVSSLIMSSGCTNRLERDPERKGQYRLRFVALGLVELSFDV